MTVHHVPAGVEAYPVTHLLYAKSKTLVGSPDAVKPNPTEKTKFFRGLSKWRVGDNTFQISKETGKALEGAQSITPINGPLYFKNCGIDLVLLNPAHKNVDLTLFKAAGIRTIVDSGGFQMLTGVTDWVDPDKVAQSYNEGATIGMPLDLPMRSALEPLYFDAVSHLIKANDKYIGKKLTEGTKLALISHGLTLDRRKARLDVIDVRQPDVVAIAGLGIATPDGVSKPFASAENFMYVINRFRERTEYFHVLGVTTSVWFFIYALCSVTKFVRSIGGDSVTYRLGAVTGICDKADFTVENIEKSIKYIQPTGCFCPVCSVVKDKRFLNHALLLESHNLWVKEYRTKYIEYLAKEYVDGRVDLTTVANVIGLRDSNSQRNFKHIVKYVMACIDRGKALPMSLAGAPRKTLWHAEHKDAPISESDMVDVIRYEKILKAYSEFHNIDFLKWANLGKHLKGSTKGSKKRGSNK